MEYLLKCLTSQVELLYWDDLSNYNRGFAYLFFAFKVFFLACLYKDFRSGSGLYSPSDPPDISESGSSDHHMPPCCYFFLRMYGTSDI